MKLRDLREDFMVFDVFETLNSRMRDLQWTFKGGQFIGSGSVEDVKLQVLIEPSTYEFDGKTHYWMNIAFRRWHDGKFTELLVGGKEYAGKIFGAVKAALEQKLSEITKLYEVDALVIFVTNEEKQRLSLYSRLTSRIFGIKWHGEFTVHSPAGIGMVLTQRSLSADQRAALSAHLEKQGKTLGG